MLPGEAGFYDGASGLACTPRIRPGGTAMFIIPRRGTGVVVAFVLLYVMLNAPWLA
jgi:hypothetical protein